MPVHLRMALVAVFALCLLLAATWQPGADTPPTSDPLVEQPAAPLNPSTDGRYHTCGLVTEDGVTEHLAAYAERCGANR